MKTSILTFALAAASFAAVAQSQQPVAGTATSSPAAPADAYTAMLGATIAEQNAAGPAALPANIAKLERAVSARPADWLPHYYQARGYVKIGFATPGEDQKDQAFDQAQTALDQARKLPGANQAELHILQAHIYQGRITVSPMTRGMEYSGRVSEALEMARKLEPQNPRVYLLMANSLYFQPAEFGGGSDKAKPLYEKAKALFAAYQPATALSPSWGESNATARLEQIASETAAAKSTTK